MDATIAAFNTTIAGGTINQGTIDGGSY